MIEPLKILLHDKNEPTYDLVDWDDFRIGYFIDKCFEKNSANEDSLYIVGNETHLAFGVSDGAGGHPKGKEAAFITGKGVIDSFRGHDGSRLHLLPVIEDINDQILDLRVGAHCTLAMALISKENMRGFSVGDSEIIYWNSTGSEIYSNIPASNIGHQIEGGVLEQEASLDAPERHIVNNMLGDPTIRIETTSKIPIKKGHTILIGSDGLFDNISHEGLAEIVAKGVFEKSFQVLVDKCLKRKDDPDWKKSDDISFILLRRVKS